MRRKSIVVFVAFVTLAVAWLWATDVTYPQWWIDYGVVPAQPPASANTTDFNAWKQDNLAIANLGQLKYVATQAKSYLDNHFAAIGGAGPGIDGVVGNFTNDSANNTVTLNLGQLKYVAKPFYDRLVQVGFNTTADLITRTGNMSWTAQYPWTVNGNATENLALANLGQLKFVFTFDLGNDTATGNTSGNFAPVASLSTRSDGIPDWWLVANGLDPLSANVGNQTSLGDLTNAQQFQLDSAIFAVRMGGSADPEGGGYDSFLRSYQAGIAEAAANSAPAPQNYESGGEVSVTFPARAIPQYTVVDLGDGEPIDMNNRGEVLIFDYEDYYTYTFYSNGFYEDVTGDGYNTWLNVNEDSSIMGFYYEGDWDWSFERLDADDNYTYVTTDDILWDYVPGDATDAYVDWREGFETRTGLFVPVYYGIQTQVAVDFDDEPVYAESGYVEMIRFAPDGSWGRVGDAVLQYGPALPYSANVTYALATTPQGDSLSFQLVVVGGASYDTENLTTDDYLMDVRYEGDEEDMYEVDTYGNSTYTNYSLKPLGNLRLNGSLIPPPFGGGDASVYDYYGSSFGANERPVANITGQVVAVDPYFTYDGKTLVVADGGGNTDCSELTDRGGGEPIYLSSLNGLGLGCFAQLWLDGRILQPPDILPKWAFRPAEGGAYRLNLAALGVDATMDDPQLEVYLVTGNSTLAAGVVYDAANLSVMNRAVLLVPVAASLAVDLNRDGAISFDVDDRTSSENPFRFWLNDDDDISDTDLSAPENIPAVTPDYTKDTITTKRGLEDFARLDINMGGLQDAIVSGNIRVGLKWASVSSGAPAIKIWRNLSPNGDAEYLTNDTVAASHLSLTAPGNISGNTTYLIPTQFWVDMGLSSSNTTGHLLFEACTAGRGQVVVTLNKPDGTEIAVGGGVWMDLKSIKDMYVRIQVTPRDPSGIPAPYDETSTFDDSTAGYEVENTGHIFSQPATEAHTVLVFVPGSNIDYTTSVWQAETMFKRLYWQGYQGRFVMFYWDTLVGLGGGFVPAHYNLNEYRAWKYGGALKNYVASLPSTYAKNVVAHSLGSGVVVSALNKGMPARNIIFMQGAMPASSFNASATTLQRLTDAETSHPTPEAIADMGYAGAVPSNTTASIYNMYNTEDYALGWWVTNQANFKPESGVSQYYTWTSTGGGQLWERHLTGPDTQIRFVTDKHESIAFISRSRTVALGAGSTGGTVTNNQNVGAGTASNFGDERPDHSGEFTHPIQQLNSFYLYLLRRAE